MSNKEQPFIHLFKTSTGHYLYDVNMDKILKISFNVYCFLKSNGKEYKDDPNVLYYIERVKRVGFLKSTHVEETEHPDTDYVKYYLRSGLENLVLQVTQNCNLRCEYCVYSEGSGYNNRHHNNKRMSWETAKKAIDYFLDHSRDSEVIYIGFYGGEPLLEIPLIKKCMDYILENVEFRRVNFNITTNATLLNEEVIQFLVDYHVYLLFSFDGPKQIQDAGRKFAGTGKGTYEKVMDNIRLFQKKHKEYFEQYVDFNSVLCEGNSFQEIYDFYKTESVFRKSKISIGFPSDSDRDTTIKIDDNYYAEYSYYKFLLFLYKTGWFKINVPYMCSVKDINLIGRLEKSISNTNKKLPRKGHHSGPCVPGAFRMFVNIDGDIFSCERVSEVAGKGTIGNIETGINERKVKDCINFERLTAERCHNCWAYNQCNLCITYLDKLQKTNSKGICEVCENVKKRVESNLKDYVILNEMGYNPNVRY